MSKELFKVVALSAGVCLLCCGCTPKKDDAGNSKKSARASSADVVKSRSIQEIIKGNGGAQLVEGFAEIIEPVNYDPGYPDYRGISEAWMDISRGPAGGQELVWKTAAPHKKKKTIFVFTGSNGEDEGDIDLSVNGNKVLIFSSAVKENRTWRKGDYILDYIHKAIISGYSGVYFLTVPEKDIKSGAPCEIKVRHIDGEGNAWFRIKSYKDTLEHEDLNRLSAAS